MCICLHFGPNILLFIVIRKGSAFFFHFFAAFYYLWRISYNFCFLWKKIQRDYLSEPDSLSVTIIHSSVTQRANVIKEEPGPDVLAPLLLTKQHRCSSLIGSVSCVHPQSRHPCPRHLHVGQRDCMRAGAVHRQRS